MIPVSAEVGDLLAAVREAVSLPLPTTAGDRKRYREILEERVDWVRAVLTAALDWPDTDRFGAAWYAELLRDKLAEHPPVGYWTGPWPGEPVQAGEPGAGGGGGR